MSKSILHHYSLHEKANMLREYMKKKGGTISLMEISAGTNISKETIKRIVEYMNDIIACKVGRVWMYGLKEKEEK